MKHYLLMIIAATLLTFGCKKEDEEKFPPEPEIQLVSLEPRIVKNFDNEVTLTISYTDNNGDLGFMDPDVPSLAVQDSRLDTSDWFHVPPLAPLGEELKIEGELTIQLTNLFILGNGETEITDFNIRIRDRNGNWSNLISTPQITIQK